MRKVIGSLAVGILLAGCANAPAPAQVSQSSNFIMMAGFTKIDRDSPEFTAIVHTVPPHRFGHRTVAGVTTYYYVDPTICGCVYTGNSQAWAAYKALASEKMHMDANLFLERVDMPADTGSG